MTSATPPPCLFAFFVLHKDNQSFINCIYSYFSQSYRALFLSWLTRASCIILFISWSPFSLCKWDWFYIHSHFFSNSQVSFVFLKWYFFPLKFNASFVNWRIVSMSPVQILKIKVLFTKIWLKIKVLFYFKSFSFVSSCINEDSYNLFSFKTLFLFPFHSVFHSVPFSVPFSVPRVFRSAF